LLGELEAKTGRVVVADLEAGVGTISRLDKGDVDLLVLVVEPYAKSLEVGRRALEIAREVGIEEVLVVASRVVDDDDVRMVSRRLTGVPVMAVPEDPAVLEADRVGVAPIDQTPHGPAVTAISQVAETLVPSTE
jgi:CO dehydrogenase maturation factor